jgi:hypothetical protein
VYDYVYLCVFFCWIDELILLHETKISDYLTIETDNLIKCANISFGVTVYFYVKFSDQY